MGKLADNKVSTKGETTTKTLTTKEVSKILSNPHVSKSKGVFTVRKSFFYRHGYTSTKLVEAVKAQFPNAVIVEHREIWKDFRGGDTVAQGSHWYVKFTFPTE